MHSPKKPLRLLPALALVVAAAFHPPAKAAAQERPETVRIDFRAIAWKGLGGELFFESGGREHRLLVPNRGFTAVFNYTGVPPLVFYRKLPGPEGTTVKQAVARADIRESGYHLLLMAKDPGTGEAGTIRIMPMPFDGARYAKDQLTVFNLSADEVALMLGDERILLPGKERRDLSARAGEDGNLGIRVVSRHGGRWLTQLATTLSLRQGSQSLLFIFKPDPEHPKLDFKLVSLTPEEPPRPPDGGGNG